MYGLIWYEIWFACHVVQKHKSSFFSSWLSRNSRIIGHIRISESAIYNLCLTRSDRLLLITKIRFSHFQSIHFNSIYLSKKCRKLHFDREASKY